VKNNFTFIITLSAPVLETSCFRIICGAGFYVEVELNRDVDDISDAASFVESKIENIGELVRENLLAEMIWTKTCFS